MADRVDGAAVPGNLRERLGNLFLDAARVLMVHGTVGVVAIVGSPGIGNAAQAFICLLLWLLGAWFLALAPVAERLPRAVPVAAAIANAVLGRNHFAPLN